MTQLYSYEVLATTSPIQQPSKRNNKQQRQSYLFVFILVICFLLTSYLIFRLLKDEDQVRISITEHQQQQQHVLEEDTSAISNPLPFRRQRPEIKSVLTSDIHNVSTSEYPFFQRGVPLLEEFAPNRWKPYHHIFSSIGSSLENNLNCTRKNAKNQVRLVFSASGFGSNMMIFSDSVIIAFHLKKQFVYISRRYQSKFEENCDRCYDKYNPFSLLWEDKFTFAKKHETMCENFDETCANVWCRTAITDKYTGNIIRGYLHSQADLFLGSRVELIRLFTRVQESVRVKVNELIENIDFNSGVTIGIHIRRGDKYLETKPTEEKHYFYAAMTAMKQFLVKSMSIYPGRSKSSILNLVIISTDSGDAATKLVEFWKRAATNHNFPVKGFIIRNSVEETSGRPDFIRHIKENDRKILEESTYLLLADLKCLTLADIFIGTKSSNFGEVVCYLRGGHYCFDAERRSNPYEWNHKKDKVTL